MIEFRMPSLGADMESGFLREWKVKPGDQVKRGDIIAEVETQKGIIDIEVFDDGIIGELLIREDDKVPVGTLMTHILAVGEKAVPIAVTPAAKGIAASPLAKRIAHEKGIDLSLVKGTGPDGVITRADVEKAITGRMSPEPAQEKSASPADNMRKAVAAAMSKSNREIPHYYLEKKIDMSKALHWMQEANEKRPVKNRLLPVALLIKAVAKAVEEVPELNAWWDNDIQLKKGIHVGLVISLRTGGIMVPSIHDANQKSVDELMMILTDLIPRARAQRLKSSEISETTITITSLGENQVETVYGVIYPPQVALVGFGSITEQPWAENGKVDVRQVVTATLSADHRATDGSTGSKFLMALNKNLQQPEKL